MIATSAALAAAAALTLTGCGSDSTDGQAAPASDAAASTSAETTSATSDAASSGDSSAGGSFDLCSTISVDDAKPFARSTKPIGLRKTLEQYKTEADARLICQYGNYIQAGLSLSVPLEKQRPTAATLAELAPIDGGPPATEISIGSEKGYVSEDDLSKSVAFMKGKVPFVLHWRSLREVEGETMTIPQLTKLAETVAAKLPTSRSDLKVVDLPKECAPLKADPIVGKVTAAFGSADEDKLICSYNGEKGVVVFNATKDDPVVIEKTTNLNNQVRPESRIDPPVAPDVTLWQKTTRNVADFSIDGAVANAGTFWVRYAAPYTADKRGPQLDPEESKITTDFAAAIRGWGA